MALVRCQECSREVSTAASSCPNCGHPVTASSSAPLAAKFRGPPDDCRHCGGDLKKQAKATSQGSGCLIALVGLLLTPVLVGIPIILYGLHLAGKREGMWRCRRCEATFPREIRWYEFG